jgi:hypothetical protein
LPSERFKINALAWLPMPAMCAVFAIIAFSLLQFSPDAYEESIYFPGLFWTHVAVQLAIGLVTRQAAFRAARQGRGTTTVFAIGWLAQAIAFGGMWLIALALNEPAQ